MFKRVTVLLELKSVQAKKGQRSTEKGSEKMKKNMQWLKRKTEKEN